MTTEKTSKGGFREGAGRKKELPEGAKATYFNITEEERKACKKLIAEMRKRNAAEISKEDQALKIIEDVSKSVAQALYEIIKLYGGRGKGFREAESMGKFLGVVAFKDAVQIFENEEYNAQEGKTTKSVKA